MRGITEQNSSSLLPKTRRVYKQFKIQDSVLQSRNESSRLADVLSQNTQGMTPSIRKALKDRANFYRRKLTFYENLGVLALSMTSQEIQAKLQEAMPDMNSSQATSIMNQLSNWPPNHYSQLSQRANGQVRTNTPKSIDNNDLPELGDSSLSV